MGTVAWSEKEPYVNRSVQDRALEAATEAARKAGHMILSYYRSSYDVRQKSVDNPVTTADLAADRMLREPLLGAFPAAGWLSEESADNAERLQRQVIWIVDPIDGTKEFIRGIDEFVVVVALVVQQQVAVAVTYNPTLKEVGHACRGHRGVL
ncbi:3'(2'),5'-bisphosphate nucleotidase CysQ [Candidatus Entotheonellaceae bacterium PAL068K]